MLLPSKDSSNKMHSFLPTLTMGRRRRKDFRAFESVPGEHLCTLKKFTSALPAFYTRWTYTQYIQDSVAERGRLGTPCSGLFAAIFLDSHPNQFPSHLPLLSSTGPASGYGVCSWDKDFPHELDWACLLAPKTYKLLFIGILSSSINLWETSPSSITLLKSFSHYCFVFF